MGTQDMLYGNAMLNLYGQLYQGCNITSLVTMV